MITYRKATADDVRPGLELVEKVWIEYDLPDMDSTALKTFRNDITRSEETVERYASGRSTMLIAADGEKIVGVIGAGSDGYIRLLFVEGEYHRRGIAIELMHRTVCELKLRGFNLIKLNSSRSGLPFYKHFGFVQTGSEQKINGFLSTPMEYTPNEIWDVLDINGNKTGRFHERGRKMAAGDYHLIVQVWKYNKKGEWLINQRSLNRGTSIDGKWETTGGSVLAGEDSLTAALREAKEELGLELDASKGTFFKRLVRHGNDGHTWLQDAWIFEHDCSLGDVRFQEGETCDVLWATTDKIRKMMAAGEFLNEWFYPYFDEMMKKWGKM